MAEKTYVAVVAHENVKVGAQVTVEEGSSPRLESLLGAGYYYVKNVAWPVVEVEVAALEADDDTDRSLLERDEDQDVVEKPVRTRAPRRAREQ